jgi:hypothetical protein
VRRTAREPSRQNDLLSLEQAAIAGLGVVAAWSSRTTRSVMPAHSRSKNGVASLAYVAGRGFCVEPGAAAQVERALTKAKRDEAEPTPVCRKI